MPPKRKIPPCGNPLYLKWLEEWMQEAKAINNNKSYYVYKKVILKYFLNFIYDLFSLFMYVHYKGT